MDLTEEEGLYTQRAYARFGFGDWVEGGFGFRLSSPMTVVFLAVFGCVGLGFFAWAMRSSSHQGWILFSVMVMAMAVLAGAVWFARYLVKHEKHGKACVTETRDAAGHQCITTNKTISRTSGSKRKPSARGKGQRGRYGRN
ncbi:hypothetical protein [Actinoplanes sp. NPDC049599]|uniref:hypothetical protein n=1 Tax=Actinoplanes sp. NPDC049599 TaxID=3363903 RepID=UPI0037A4AC8A